MQIIRKSSFTATPWKNGRGITHEAIRVPSNGNEFRWRVSIAQIEVSGPFSDFAGYDRKMVLLHGSGVRLTFEGGLQACLRDVGDLTEFDGGLPAYCDLLGGPCTDLNLMVTRSIKDVRAWVERLQQPRVLPPRRGTTLVFGISGELSMDSDEGQCTCLDPWDLAVASPGEGGTVSPASRKRSDAPLVFFAVLEDPAP